QFVCTPRMLLASFTSDEGVTSRFILRDHKPKRLEATDLTSALPEDYISVTQALKHHHPCFSGFTTVYF
ncbi:MAG: hypothetical protein ACRC41_13560, partial [Sarcina sp.]